MNSKINPQKLNIIIVIVMGLLFAFNAGNLVADEQFAPILGVLGTLLVLSIIFGLGSSIFILVPACWGLTGQISVLPLPFSVRQLVIILTSVIFISGWIFNTRREKPTFEMIDLWIWINLVNLAVVFLRNPVGVAAIGGTTRVGGKPYVDVLLGLMAYIMLSSFKISSSTSKRLPVYALGCIFFNALGECVAMFLPNVGFYLGQFYNEFTTVTASGEDVGTTLDVGETRFSFLQLPGVYIILYIISRLDPSRLIRPENLMRLVLFLIGYIMIFLSGFRNALIGSLANTGLSILFRQRTVGFFKILVFVMLFAFSAIALSYSPIKLPISFQRTLSFLPGQWDEMAIQDAKNSVQWRWEMWDLALNTDRYIHNKVFGDGFGFLREDYQRAIDISMAYTQLRSDEAQQEMFLLDGDYHSGPVGSIRFVGYFGLVLILPLFYLMVRMAIRLVNYARGTEFEFCAYFYGIQAIMLPFFFLFVVGDYRQDLVSLLFFVGMMKMLNKSISVAKQE